MVQSDWPQNHNKSDHHRPMVRMIDNITITQKKGSPYRKNIPYEKEKKGTYLWGEIVGNSPIVSQSPTLDTKYKVKHYTI